MVITKTSTQKIAIFLNLIYNAHNIKTYKMFQPQLTHGYLSFLWCLPWMAEDGSYLNKIQLQQLLI